METLNELLALDLAIALDVEATTYEELDREWEAAVAAAEL